MDANHVLVSGTVSQELSPDKISITRGKFKIEFQIGMTMFFNHRGFIDCIFWAKSSKQLDYVVKNLRKGVKVYICGRLNLGHWTTKDGHKKNKVRIQVIHIDIKNFVNLPRVKDDYEELEDCEQLELMANALKNPDAEV